MAVVPFYGTLTIAAGTTAAVPATTTIHVAPGILVLFTLYVPPGPRGTVALYLKHQERQFAPVPPEVWDGLDGVTKSFPFNYALGINMTDLTLVGYAPYANFQHKIGFEALVDTTEPATLAATPQSLLNRISGLFGG